MNRVFWSCVINPSEPFSFGKVEANATLHLCSASINLLEKERDTKVEIPEHLKSKIIEKEKNRKERGLVLQVCIKDESTQKRKKFVLGLLKDSQPTLKFDLYFDKDQIENISFEAKGRPHLNKDLCELHLSGYMTIGDLTEKDILDIGKELSENKAKEIKDELLKKRKELPKRIKVLEPEESDEEIPEAEKVGSRYNKDGVHILNYLVGFGRRAKKGDKVSIYFKGKLDPTKPKCFDKTKLGKPFTFVLGTKKVIKGVNIGVEGMTLNAKREIIIPSHLAFGKTGFQDKVPSNATVYYDVELVEIIPRKKVQFEKKKREMEIQKRKMEKLQKEQSFVKDKETVELE